MDLFSGLKTKIHYWNERQDCLNLTGVTPRQWCFLASSYFQQDLFENTHLIVCSEQDEAEEVYESLKHLKNVYFYPGHNHSLYSSILTSESALLARWAVLQRLVKNEKIIIIATTESSLLLSPDQTFFQDQSFVIRKDDIIGPLELAQKLTNMGYFPSSTVEEPGTFSKKGEIFDIYPISHP